MTKKVLGVLGGDDLPDHALDTWARGATHLYAADYGAERLVRLGLRPVLVGDLDSFDRQFDHLVDRVVHDEDQATTDCDKMLALMQDDGHDAVTLAGIEGDLIDHVMASLSSMVASALTVRVVVRRGLLYLVRGGTTCSVPAEPGARVSLLPAVPSRVQSILGVRWELSDELIQVGGRLSVSNEATGPVTVDLESGAAWLFVESKNQSPWP